LIWVFVSETFSVLFALHSLVDAASPKAAVSEYDTANRHNARAPADALALPTRRLKVMKNGQRELQRTARIANARYKCISASFVAMVALKSQLL